MWPQEWAAEAEREQGVIGVEGIKEPRGLGWGCVTHMRRGEA